MNGIAPGASVDDEDRIRALKTARALDAWGTARAWAGPDPYDALNAPLAGSPVRHWPLGLRFLTQLVKRSPIDLRPLIGIRPAVSAAAVAHLLSAFARNGFLTPEVAHDRLRWSVKALGELRCEGYDEACWGYHFDVQTRVFYYPKTAPNTIVSAFAGLGLLDVYERTGDESALELATSTGTFFLDHVPQTEVGGGAYFGYLVGDRTPIHNSSMLVCALLARLARQLDRPDMRAAAEAGVAYTVQCQRPDGSWPYGESPGLEWVDGFHTGYVLDCMLACAEAGIQNEARASWERGLRFYADSLFLPDSTPKYGPHSVYPIDGQCAAQAIQTFSLASRYDAAYAERAWSSFRAALAQLGSRNGTFAFQHRRLWVNRTPHPRWVQAPILHALTHLLSVPTS